MDTGTPKLGDEPGRLGASGTMWGLLGARPRRTMLRNLLGKLRLAITYAVGRAGRRDRRLWVFGNFKGFRDSPRYLAEHIVHSCPHLTACWIARTTRDADEARAAGLRVAMLGDSEATRLQRRAGVAFFCNSFGDLQLSRLAGVYMVHLYHGTPMKRISLDVDRRRFTRGSRMLRALAAINRWVLRRKYALVDMFVAGGELAAERFRTAFGAPAQRVRVLGTPRFDVIRGGPPYERVAKGDLRARLGYAAEDAIVLWLPTWREQGDATWLPPLSAEAVERALEGTNLRLLVKTHPFSDRSLYAERMPEHVRVKLLQEAEVDVNALLHVADVLITDYSSAMFDYAILGRPIYFLAPDLEVYGAGRDLYEPYDRVTGGMAHRDWPSLLAALRAEGAPHPGTEGAVLTRRVADYARNNGEPEVCRRVVDAVAAAVGLPDSARQQVG